MGPEILSAFERIGSPEEGAAAAALLEASPAEALEALFMWVDGELEIRGRVTSHEFFGHLPSVIWKLARGNAAIFLQLAEASPRRRQSMTVLTGLQVLVGQTRDQDARVEAIASECFAHTDEETQRLAFDLLASTRGARALDTLKAALSVPPLASPATRHLSTFGGARSVAPLLSQTQTSPDRSLRRDAWRAIAAIAAREGRPVQVNPTHVAGEEVAVPVPVLGTEGGAIRAGAVTCRIGEEMEEGDTLLSLDTDKATFEVACPTRAVVLEIAVASGVLVVPGQTLVLIARR